MQVMLNIPDVIPQEIVNRLLMQWKNQLQIEEKVASKSSEVIMPPTITGYNGTVKKSEKYFLACQVLTVFCRFAGY